jgi:hypothetical protein
MWSPFEAWTTFWRNWLKEPPVEFPKDDQQPRKPEDLHKAFQKHISEQERIRCMLDKNIEYARSLDQDILAVVNDMVRRRDETAPPE